ncbi:hypothetical protein [Clostridium sp. KNHs216]|nr:hypothetical protein [Clostridium sp. KNHs216]
MNDNLKVDSSKKALPIFPYRPLTAGLLHFVLRLEPIAFLFIPI